MSTWKVIYFDFEASTDGAKHLPYCVCFSTADGSKVKSFYGRHCARSFLNELTDKTICYAHNLTYDINFIIDLLDVVYEGSIIKGSKVYSIKGSYNGKSLNFKDTYCIITAPLCMFPSMFNLDSGRKECFPYQYYDSKVLGLKDRSVIAEVGSIDDALEFLPPSEHNQFIENVKEFASRGLPDGMFSMKRYCIFYCEQDVNILRQGFEFFRKSLLETFSLDVYNFISISSIANRYMELHCYWQNGNLYDLANTPREFISRCIHGGRCMLADNVKHYVLDDVVDFDAVSLYPSAIARLYTLEGAPKVLQSEQLTQQYLLDHLFTDNQLEPTRDRFMSGFFIEAIIKEVGIKRHFPLIVYDPDWNEDDKVEHERSENTPCRMYMDHIMFEDLIRFQHCKIQPVRGYYYNEKRDARCQQVIRNLFDLRAKYKREGNPLQNIIKLLLNSIYGKTILKPIDTRLRFINSTQKEKYIMNRYHYIKEMIGYADCHKFMSIEYKPYSKHFSFVPFGVNILSMSKRIMNELICSAEDLDIEIYYQDTDSIQLRSKDLTILADEFEKRYHRKLIGKELGQFHPDFESF